jgi:hypothetical protein
VKNDEEEANPDSDSSEEICSYYQEIFSYSTAGEVWVKCSLCDYWAKDACAGVEEEDCDEYSCYMCKNIKQKLLALVYHSSLYNNFLDFVQNRSNNQVHSAIKYSFPHYPTCRVKQGIALFYKIYSYNKTTVWNQKISFV